MKLVIVTLAVILSICYYVASNDTPQFRPIKRQDPITRKDFDKVVALSTLKSREISERYKELGDNNNQFHLFKPSTLKYEDFVSPYQMNALISYVVCHDVISSILLLTKCSEYKPNKCLKPLRCVKTVHQRFSDFQQVDHTYIAKIISNAGTQTFNFLKPGLVKSSTCPYKIELREVEKQVELLKILGQNATIDTNGLCKGCGLETKKISYRPLLDVPIIFSTSIGDVTFGFIWTIFSSILVLFVLILIITGIGIYFGKGQYLKRIGTNLYAMFNYWIQNEKQVMNNENNK